MRTLHLRLLVLGVSTAVCAGLAWLWLASRPPREAIRLVDDWPAGEELLLKHRSDAGSVAGSGLVREPVDAGTARKLWISDPKLHVYDPYCYYRYKGGLDFDSAGDLPEGAEGGFHVRTSAEGYREDYDHLPEHRDVFVVVTGDSHTDGVCENRQSFANRLEAKLAERHPGKAIEVVNTGVSGYSFYNYLGSLERHLALKPDAFVVGWYGGNDFIGVLRPYHYFHHTVPPPRSQEYQLKLYKAAGISGTLVGNAFNQLLYFEYNPDQIDVALRAADETCAEIVRLCREHRIAPFFLYIPPEVGWKGRKTPLIQRAEETLGLTDTDFTQFDTLADHVIGNLKSLGAEVIDLRETFTGDIGRYYLPDMHIDVTAHEAIADVLLPRVEAACFHARPDTEK
jgi:lysophospholipase L1-like esterase